MSDNSLASISSPVVQVVREDAMAPAEPAAVNPLVHLQVLLYGRYVYAVLLGLVLGCGGAFAAWTLVPPTYPIVGYVQVKPYVPKVLYASDENGMLPSFEPFVDLQASLLQSQRVLDRASQTPEWIALHRASTALGASGISSDALVVDHPRGSELITVTVTDRDQNVAMVAVKSILQAYMEISGEANGVEDAHRLQVLEDLRTSLTNQARGIQNQILAIANDYGTDDLSQRYQMKVSEANNLEVELQQINLDLSIAQATPERASTTAPASEPAVTVVTREDVAAVDIRMRDLLNQEDQISLRLAEMQTHMGENNQAVVSARNELAFVQQRIDDLLAVYQARGGTPKPAVDLYRDRSKMSVAELTAQQANVRALYDKVQAEALDLGRKDLQLRSLKQDEDAIKHREDEASTGIEQHNVEANMANRISILSYGEKPTTPSKSKRLPLTAAAGAGGFGGGVAIVALWGLMRRRVRSVLQVQHLKPTVRMLGVLPILPDELADPEQKALAAHCVHQIRNLLDTGEHGTCRVLAITSPAAGDGKTSLSLALGLSFAAAGSRTLLVDCDMVGGGLTARLNAIVRRGIGSILRRDGLLTDDQLKQAQQIAGSTGRKLAEVLVERGFATESDVQRALAAENESSVGLLNALDGDEVAACVTPILARNLSILPLGEAAVHHTSQLSPKAFRRIIEEVRGLFDIAIIDTGPIVGSLEASIVVREVDEVVLAVSRNGRAPLVQHALSLLESLGVQLAGLVFNRATSSDVAVAYYGSSASTASMRSNRKARNGSAQHAPRLGSLAAAVASSSGNGSAKEGEDDQHDQ
jgi:Mrp family chromosome partitioning ATPase/uncharacterized protein involved in exopolysaccharide biosynthesis